MYPELLIQTLIPALLTAVLTFVERRPKWRALPYWLQQAIIGVLFGAAAVAATETGVPMGGGVINVRDAAPVVAGLAFGAPAGIIAGIIGGVERALSVMWGGGQATVVACSSATIIAGAVSGWMRAFVFDDERPVLGYATGTGAAVEALHLLLILSSSQENWYVFDFLDECMLPMLVLNSAACGLAFFGQAFLMKRSLGKKPPHLVNDIGIRIFAAVLVVFLTASGLNAYLGTQLSGITMYVTLTNELSDIRDYTEVVGWQGLTKTKYRWAVGEYGGVLIADSKTLTVLSARCRGLELDDDRVLGIQMPYDYQVTTAETLRLFGMDCYVVGQAMDDYYVIAYYPMDKSSSLLARYQSYSLLMDIIIFMTVFVSLFVLMRRRVLNNLLYMGESLDDIAAGKLETTVDVRSHQEFARLSDNINTTVEALRGYIAEAEHRHDAELELARQIQHSSLPSVVQPFPDRPDFDLHASMDAAREVGGDFYDFFLLNDHTLVFLVADVSGKGIPAALFMMKAKTQIHSLMETNIGVDEAFTEANRKLCEANDSGMFVTAWLGKLDLSSGELAFANAGHNPPLLKRAGGEYEYLRVKRPNFFLAGMEDIRYRKNTVTLNPGDKLYLYTDGVTEACDVDERLFGEERLAQTLNAVDEKASPEQTCEAVAAALKKHAAGAEQSDDITMLCVDLKAICGESHIVTRPDRDSIEIVERYFADRLPKLGVPSRTATRVQVVVDELYSNICNYAGATRAVTNIVRKESDLVIEFVDDGVEFDPTARDDADTGLSAEERAIGGLGIHMVRRMARSMAYRRVNGVNILTVTLAAN